MCMGRFHWQQLLVSVVSTLLVLVGELGNRC
jgi:hypothetical protein